MSRSVTLCIVLSAVFSNCIGTDIIEDFVEPRISVANKIEVMIVNDQYQFEAMYFDNTGANRPANFSWTSLNQEVMQIDANGLATALSPGTTTITASANETMESFGVEVLDPAGRCG